VSGGNPLKMAIIRKRKRGKGLRKASKEGNGPLILKLVLTS
jgi:hypothetical protein